MNFLRYNSPALLWTGIIAWLVFTPAEELPQLGLFSYDKFGHMLFFGLFVFLWAWGLTYGCAARLKNPLLYAFTVGIIYSVAIEIIQHQFIPGRMGDWGDVLADIIGCLIGYGIYQAWKKTYYLPRLKS